MWRRICARSAFLLVFVKFDLPESQLILCLSNITFGEPSLCASHACDNGKLEMTAQSPERLIVDGRPRPMYADPLYRLRRQSRLDLSNPNFSSTGNYRGYIGTWEIRMGLLYLVHLCWDGWDGRSCEVPISDDLRSQLFRAAGAKGFPLHAHWFNGSVRVAIGRRLIYSHHGWSHWHERERVMRFRNGEIVRDRKVDTHAILERWLKRHPEALHALDPDQSGPLGPLMWFAHDDQDWAIDWWPGDFKRASAAG